MSGPRVVEVVGAPAALTSTPLPQTKAELVSLAVGNTAHAVPVAPVAAPVSAPVEAAAPVDSSLPCAQGRVGEGCEPLAANASQPGSAQGASLPPPNLPLQAGEGAKAQASVPSSAQHTATIGQPAKPQTFAKQSEGPGVGGAVFALILVVSLILALGWLAKRMPGFGRATGGGNALRVVGSLTLGPRDRVVVVDVGGTQLLLGVGQNGMTTLHTLSEPLPVAQPSQGTPNLQNLATPFAQLLAKHLGKKP